MLNRHSTGIAVRALLAAGLTLAMATSPSSRGLAMEDSPAGEDWSILLTATGGNLSTSVISYNVSVVEGKTIGTRDRKSSGGEVKRESIDVSEQALAGLKRTIEEVKAWDMMDFSSPQLDAPDYTIRLEKKGKAHTIHVSGAGKSEKHLKLIRSIQECFPRGAPR